jgi:hypothetical protein
VSFQWKYLNISRHPKNISRRPIAPRRTVLEPLNWLINFDLNLVLIFYFPYDCGAERYHIVPLLRKLLHCIFHMWNFTCVKVNIFGHQNCTIHLKKLSNEICSFNIMFMAVHTSESWLPERWCRSWIQRCYHWTAATASCHREGSWWAWQCWATWNLLTINQIMWNPYLLSLWEKGISFTK